jgi:hypothetical protein
MARFLLILEGLAIIATAILTFVVTAAGLILSTIPLVLLLMILWYV